MRSLSKGDVLSDKKFAKGSSVAGSSTQQAQSQSNSAILRKSTKSLKPGGGSRPIPRILSNRDRVEAIQSEI